MRFSPCVLRCRESASCAAENLTGLGIFLPPSWRRPRWRTIVWSDRDWYELRLMTSCRCCPRRIRTAALLTLADGTNIQIWFMLSVYTCIIVTRACGHVPCLSIEWYRFCWLCRIAAVRGSSACIAHSWLPLTTVSVGMASECRLGTSLVRVAKDCFAWKTQTDLIQSGFTAGVIVNKCKTCEEKRTRSTVQNNCSKCFSVRLE